jgi:U3 small nucleolar ribonucleoprotein protein IMP4
LRSYPVWCPNLTISFQVSNILKFLYPVPKEESKRVMTFSNESDFISFRHHVFYKVGNDVQLAEVGPRFEMRCEIPRFGRDEMVDLTCFFVLIVYEIRLGTVDQTEADVEWKLRPYQNTAKKRDVL